MCRGCPIWSSQSLRPRLKKGKVRGAVVIRGHLATITTAITRDEAAVAVEEVKMVAVVVLDLHQMLPP